MPVTPRCFWMIRHGQTQANESHVMAGSTETPLTALGRDQARAAGLLMRDLPKRPGVIWHSPLSRARETAEIINEYLRLPMREDADLAEMDAGAWEGQSYAICRPMLDGWQDPPGGETFAEFLNRVLRVKNRALAETTQKEPLFVCHGGVFRAFAKLYDYDIWGVRNADLHYFEPCARTSVAGKNFPWTVWRHEDSINRVLSDSYHPDGRAPDHLLESVKDESAGVLASSTRAR